MSGPGAFGRSSGIDDWVRDHRINGNAFGPSVGSDTSFTLPSLPNDLVDWFAGFGDALTFGLTRYTRDVTGIGSVDTSSGYYSSGHLNGAVASVLFSAGAAVVAEAAALTRAAALRISGMLDIDLTAAAARSAATAEKGFFQGSRYSQKVLEQMRRGPGEFHSFPESAVAFENAGTVRFITGGDGIARQMLEIPGSYAGRTGVFQSIKEADGTINHRLFVPDL